MGYRKLSPEEISDVVAKIRTKYTFYCKTFFKSSRLKDEFENRYMITLKKGYDISNFLLAEISVIEELIRKEEDRIAHSKPKEDSKRRNFADKIILENLEKIRKYPHLEVHRDANEEIKYLSGALNTIYETHIPMLHGLSRHIEGNLSVKTIENQESRLRVLAYGGKTSIPSQLSRYVAYLNRFPRDYRAIEWEEKEYILESAFILHDMFGTLSTILQTTSTLPKPEQTQLMDIIAYIRGMIEDFRLKDLKRKK
ncbi:MAG: hypothetical protein JW881_11960 [Spirochaetales bacterium]|nr:hypothetical protein [Spirochaetales bacterium]